MKTAKTKNIQFKATKCRFAQTSVMLLGHLVGSGVRQVDPRKADALRDWPDPKEVSDIISFRAYANWIREYIPNFV